LIAGDRLWVRVLVQALMALMAASIASVVLWVILVTGIALWDRQTKLAPADRAVIWDRDYKEFRGIKRSGAETARYRAIKQPEGSVAVGVVCYILSVAACGALGATWLGFRVRRYVGPISLVAQNARSLADGDLSARIGLAASDVVTAEVAQLVRDFDVLAAQLQRSERALRQSSASIAHELRTPLQVLRGRLEALNDGLLTADAAEYARLLNQIRILTRLVEDLATLSLAQAGKLSVRPTEIELSDLVREAVETFQARLPDVDIQLTLPPMTLRADAERLGQAVTALLDNAGRYGGSLLEVEVWARGEEAGVRIRDSGAGFPIIEAGTIVEPFVRGEPSRSRASGGSGLGLSIVDAIARAHGGRLVLSPPGRQGAEAIIAIPRRH
jgi:signal transduction histidine kinase